MILTLAFLGLAVVQQDTLRDPSVAKCIRDRARHWQFPATQGGVAVVTYPFDLRIQ